MPKNKSKFQDLWLSNPSYATWLVKKDDRTARCRLCCTDISIAAMAESALTSHIKGKKHSQKVSASRSPLLRHFGVKQKSTEVSEVGAPSSVVTNSEEVGASSSVVTNSEVGVSSSVVTNSEVGGSSIEDYMIQQNIDHAVIRCVLRIVVKNLPINTCTDLNEFVATTFNDSAIAQNFKLDRTKCSYIINHGLAPYFRDLLMKEINESPVFVISFDESLNKNLQKGQMDILIRLWNSIENIAETRYFNSEFLGGAKAERILSVFDKAVEKLDLKNLLQISSDGPNVNLKFLSLYKQKRDFHELAPLIDIGTCGLHVVHGSVKTGVKASDWKLGKILKGLSKLVEDSPARRESYQNITETNLLPLPYCGHRWCENEDVCSRAFIIWPSIVKFIEYLKKLPTSKQLKGKSFTLLSEAVRDPFIEAKLKLLEFVTGKLNKFLRGFQCDQPMVPFLHVVLKEILTTFLSMFVSNEEMSKATTTRKLMQIDLDDEKILKSGSKINVGMGAQLILTNYQKRKDKQPLLLKLFYQEARSFLSSLVKHMIEKSPLKHLLVLCATSLCPKEMVENKEGAELKFSKLLENLATNKRISTKVADEAKAEYSQYICNIAKHNTEKFKNFDMFKERLDRFQFQFFLENKDNYANLQTVFIFIFCLSHGQAPIERGFKRNKEMSRQNQSEASLIALRLVSDHMLVHNLKPHTIKIGKEMERNVRAASSRYRLYLEEKKKEKVSTDKELKRKVVDNEIAEVKKKKLSLESSIEEYVKEADELAFKAEKCSDMKLVIKSNDLRKLVKVKKAEVVELQKMEESLKLRKEDII